MPDERFDAYIRQIQIKNPAIPPFYKIITDNQSTKLVYNLVYRKGRGSIEFQAPGLLEPFVTQIWMSVRGWGWIQGARLLRADLGSGIVKAEVYVRFRVINCLAVRSGLVFFEDDAAALGLRSPVRTLNMQIGSLDFADEFVILLKLCKARNLTFFQFYPKGYSGTIDDG